MALPKLQVPEYFLVVPSTGEEIKYRPFLVKEEKILLIAFESEDDKQINNAILNLVHGCTFDALGNKDTPLFDLEYAFLQIRAKSVGETTELNILCPDDEKTRVKVEVNLSEVQVQMNKEHSLEINLTDEITLMMKYPTIMDTVTTKKTDTENIFAMLNNCMHEVHVGDDITNMVDVSEEEKEEFVGNMTQPMFEKIQTFFETMPKLRHVINIKNPKTKKKSEVLLEGLSDFFG